MNKKMLLTSTCIPVILLLATPAMAPARAAEAPIILAQQQETPERSERPERQERQERRRPDAAPGTPPAPGGARPPQAPAAERPAGSQAPAGQERREAPQRPAQERPAQERPAQPQAPAAQERPAQPQPPAAQERREPAQRPAQERPTPATPPAAQERREPQQRPAQTAPATPPAAQDRPAQPAPAVQSPAAPPPRAGQPPASATPAQPGPAQPPAATGRPSQTPPPAAGGQPSPAAPAGQPPASATPAQPSPPPAATGRPPQTPPAAGAQPSPAPAGQPASPGQPPAAAQQPLPAPTVQGGAIQPQPTGAQGQPLRSVDQIRGERRETTEGGRTFIREPDRTIIREGGRTIIRHSEVDRFRHDARDVRSERQGSETITYIERPDGARITSVVDDEGRLLRRTRRDANGREVIIIDNRYRGPVQSQTYYVDLPPPVVRIPRERYILETERASERDIHAVLSAPPVERIERRYTLDEVRYSPRLRDRMPRVDIDTINFDSGSWAIAPDQVNRLAGIAGAVKQAIADNPVEVFLVEGHTDAIGSDDDNLSLSDRRAESVAVVLTQQFGVPAENLTTQGYGEQYPKVPTQAAERQNRRVALRRITPLLAGQN